MTYLLHYTCLSSWPRCLLTPLLVAFLSLQLSGCSEEETAASPQFGKGANDGQMVYRFGIHPLHNPKRLHDIFDPLMRYLSRHFEDVEFKVEASRNYAAYDEKLFAGAFHFSLPNPYQTLKSLDHGYHVFGKMGDDHDFRGIILVRKDSGINSVADLRGKPVSYPAPTALAATMLPQYFLYQNGLDVMNEVDNRYVGSQESSIMNVFHGHTVAGATWPPPWRVLLKERPELEQALEIKWQTEPLPNNGLVVRDDIPASIVNKVAELVFELHKHDEGRMILERMELSHFEVADDQTYQPVHEFIRKFEHDIRDPQKER